MIAAEVDFRNWIQQYFYGTVDDQVVANDAESCIEYMRERGWYWERMPDEASHD